AILLFAVILNYVVPDKVFIYISAVATVAVITNWMIILLAQLKSRKSKSKDEVAGLKFKIPFFPISTYIAIAFLLLVIVLMALIPDMRIALYVAPVWFIILYVGYRGIN